MPHSPYIQKFEPPVSDFELETSKYNFQRIRWEYEEVLEENLALDTALNDGELLIKHCEFLEAKLSTKKTEISLLTMQSDALAKRFETLELESGMREDDKTRHLGEMEQLRTQNDAYKKELATVKAKLGMEIEELRTQNDAYKKELTIVKSRLGKDKLETPMMQSRFCGDQARDAYKSIDPTRAAAGKHGRNKCGATEPATATWRPLVVPPESVKRDRVPDMFFNQPQKKAKWMPILKVPGGEDATVRTNHKDTYHM